MRCFYTKAWNPHIDIFIVYTKCIPRCIVATVFFFVILLSWPRICCCWSRIDFEKRNWKKWHFSSLCRPPTRVNWILYKLNNQIFKCAWSKSRILFKSIPIKKISKQSSCIFLSFERFPQIKIIFIKKIILKKNML